MWSEIIEHIKYLLVRSSSNGVMVINLNSVKYFSMLDSNTVTVYFSDGSLINCKMTENELINLFEGPHGQI